MERGRAKWRRVKEENRKLFKHYIIKTYWRRRRKNKRKSEWWDPTWHNGRRVELNSKATVFFRQYRYALSVHAYIF